MKKLYTLSISVFILATTTSAQSLVAYYPFTGNANDASSNSNNGTINGATLANDRTGTPNNAYSFNGSANNISVSDNATLAFTTNYTIIAWVNAVISPSVSGSPGGFSIAAKDAGSGMNSPKWIFILQNGNLAYHINGAGLGNGEWLYSNPFSLTTNQWYRVAMSKSGNSVSFYVNGISMGTFSLTNPSVNPSTVLQLGNAEAGMGFNGYLDEMKFYNSALTSMEIANDYAIALPLTLIDFSAINKENTVAISWITELESDLAYFDIERSTESSGFEKAATVTATGGISRTSYSINDHMPLDGINFYRLKCVDVDGQFSYSKVVKIDFSKWYALQIYPNPAHDFIFIKGPANIKEIRIADITGKLVSQFVKSSNNKYSIRGFNKGLYWVQLISDDKMRVEKIIID